MVYENALNIFIQYLLDFCVKIWILDTIQNGILEFRSFLIGCVYKNDVLQCTHYCQRVANTTDCGENVR